eukprot:366546-Chlamydomonas_euryale.AAC.25
MGGTSSAAMTLSGEAPQCGMQWDARRHGACPVLCRPCHAARGYGWPLLMLVCISRSPILTHVQCQRTLPPTTHTMYAYTMCRPMARLCGPNLRRPALWGLNNGRLSRPAASA